MLTFFNSLTPNKSFQKLDTQCFSGFPIMLSFFDNRSQTAAKQVLPPRKSLRLQKKEAELLTLPPEPRGSLIYEQVPTYKKCM